MMQPRPTLTNSIGMQLVLIPKGAFVMGSPPEEEGRYDDETQHEVTISQDYHLGIYQVTQAQYEKVMGANPSYFQGDEMDGMDTSDHPVDSVSWEDAVEFCRRLSGLPEEQSAGRVYRLPTEAEWERACRAGSTTAYHFGNDASGLGDYGWFEENSSDQTHAVGQKQPNAWGLYDMHGNLWEWCADWHGDYPPGAVTDPRGPSEGSDRVLRGGSWDFEAAFCRSALRDCCLPSDLCSDGRGFRVALSSPGIPK